MRRELLVIVAAFVGCNGGSVNPVCAEIGEACHEAAEEQGEGSTAMECHELEEDATKTGDECEGMREDCEEACAGDTDSGA